MPDILFSSAASPNMENAASLNVASELMSSGFTAKAGGCWKQGNWRLIDSGFSRAYEVEIPRDSDLCIVLSPHRSEANKRSLTVHLPGNWDSADFGGLARTLNWAYPSLQKALLKSIGKEAKARGLDFEVSFEVDHHGPTPVPHSDGEETIQGPPIIFIEIGSGPAEWQDKKASASLAAAVLSCMDGFDLCEPAFGCGGGHYAPKFTSLALSPDSKASIGHILPKYRSASLSKDTFEQAIYRSKEPIERVLIDRKGMPAQDRELVGSFSSEFGLELSYC